MFKIVLFLEKSDEEWSTPLKIGLLFLNRLVIDEEAALEVVGKNLETRQQHRFNSLKSFLQAFFILNKLATK